MNINQICLRYSEFILLNTIILNLLSCPYCVRCSELLKITLYIAEQNIRDQQNQHPSSMCRDNEKIHKVIEIKYKTLLHNTDSDVLNDFMS